MGRLIDTSNIRVKPQYMQDVMGIAMIRCEDLSRILADVPTVDAIPKADYENRLKTDMVAILDKISVDIDELYSYVEFNEELKTSFNMVRLEEVQRVIDKYRAEYKEPQSFKWCTDCREYDQEKHCCHRWSKVIRNTVEEIKPKTGHWIRVAGGNLIDDYRCDCCNHQPPIRKVSYTWGWDFTNYCSNCGCKMIEPQESEGKE